MTSLFPFRQRYTLPFQAIPFPVRLYPPFQAKSKAPAGQGAGVASDGKAEAAEKKGFELPNPFAKKK